ncbi:MAG TPA: BlaI/MecI/CopY family transcriptional regulator [Pseudoduganella sp.]
MTIQISEAEAQVMQVLWERHPQTAEEVCEALSGQGWQDATIKTLLNRLLNKGAISAQKDGRRYLYAPALEREDWLAGESQGFLDRMFNGRLAPLVAHFSQHKALSKADIAELKKLLKELDDGK